MKSIFVSMIFYGTLVGQIGSALLLVALLILVIYVCRHMDKQDDEPCESPSSPTEGPSTHEELDCVVGHCADSSIEESGTSKGLKQQDNKSSGIEY